ncbi:MAG: copper-binding protein [Myxococcales bacterium]|nr:copper-binding protein [Myxococcales bacterium]
MPVPVLVPVPLPLPLPLPLPVPLPFSKNPLEGLAAGQRVRFTFVAERGGRHVIRSIERL